jgi:hypothetical protein
LGVGEKESNTKARSSSSEVDELEGIKIRTLQSLLDIAFFYFEPMQ